MAEQIQQNAAQLQGSIGNQQVVDRPDTTVFNSLSSALAGAEKGIKLAVQETARNKVERVERETLQEEYFRQTGENLPPEITGFGEELDAYAAALDEGKFNIDDVKLKLRSKVRQLKTEYPFMQGSIERATREVVGIDLNQGITQALAARGSSKSGRQTQAEKLHEEVSILAETSDTTSPVYQMYYNVKLQGLRNAAHLATAQGNHELGKLSSKSLINEQVRVQTQQLITRIDAITEDRINKGEGPLVASQYQELLNASRAATMDSIMKYFNSQGIAIDPVEVQSNIDAQYAHLEKFYDSKNPNQRLEEANKLRELQNIYNHGLLHPTLAKYIDVYGRENLGQVLEWVKEFNEAGALEYLRKVNPEAALHLEAFLEEGGETPIGLSISDPTAVEVMTDEARLMRGMVDTVLQYHYGDNTPPPTAQQAAMLQALAITAKTPKASEGIAKAQEKAGLPGMAASTILMTPANNVTKKAADQLRVLYNTNFRNHQTTAAEHLYKAGMTLSYNEKTGEIMIVNTQRLGGVRGQARNDVPASKAKGDYAPAVRSMNAYTRGAKTGHGEFWGASENFGQNTVDYVNRMIRDHRRTDTTAVLQDQISRIDSGEATRREMGGSFDTDTKNATKVALKQEIVSHYVTRDETTGDYVFKDDWDLNQFKVNHPEIFSEILDTQIDIVTRGGL